MIRLYLARIKLVTVYVFNMSEGVYVGHRPTQKEGLKVQKILILAGQRDSAGIL